MVFVGGVPLDRTVSFYRAADLFVYPSLNETFGLPIAGGHGLRLPGRDVGHQCHARDGRAERRYLADPKDPASIARAIVEAPGRAGIACATLDSGVLTEFTWGATAAATLDVYREAAERRRRQEMKILVTGGAGFIGSHTCDRLLALGHDVIVLDALTPPVHRNGRPAYVSPEADLYQGDTRNRDLID